MYDTAIKYSMAPKFAMDICERIFRNFNGHIMRINSYSCLESSLNGEVIKLAKLNFKSNKMSRRVVYTSIAILSAAFILCLLAILAKIPGMRVYNRISAGTIYKTGITQKTEVIDIGSGTEVSLYNDTVIKTLNPVNGNKIEASFELIKGSAYFKVRKLGMGEYFHIKTYDLDISVVGTEFIVIDTNNNSQVKVVKGTVKVSELKGTNTYFIKAGDEFNSVQKTNEDHKSKKPETLSGNVPDIIKGQ